jgi:hypothetical protein
MRDVLEVMKKSSLKGDIESNQISILKNRGISLLVSKSIDQLE